MNEQETLAKLTEMGREQVRAYDLERARYPQKTDAPIACVKISTKIVTICEVIEALGLMEYEAFEKAIHEAEHGVRGMKLVPIELSLRRMGIVQPDDGLITQF